MTATVTEKPTNGAPEPEPTPSSSGSKKHLLWVAIAAAVALVLIVAGYFAFSGGDKPSPAKPTGRSSPPASAPAQPGGKKHTGSANSTPTGVEGGTWSGDSPAQQVDNGDLQLGSLPLTKQVQMGDQYWQTAPASAFYQKHTIAEPLAITKHDASPDSLIKALDQAWLQVCGSPGKTADKSWLWPYVTEAGNNEFYSSYGLGATDTFRDRCLQFRYLNTADSSAQEQVFTVAANTGAGDTDGTTFKLNYQWNTDAQRWLLSGIFYVDGIAVL
jgi:hypothetical protein